MSGVSSATWASLSDSDKIDLGCFIAHMELVREGTWANPNDWLPGSYTHGTTPAGDVDWHLGEAARRGAVMWLGWYGDDEWQAGAADRVRKEFRL